MNHPHRLFVLSGLVALGLIFVMRAGDSAQDTMLQDAGAPVQVGEAVSEVDLQENVQSEVIPLEPCAVMCPKDQEKALTCSLLHFYNARLQEEVIFAPYDGPLPVSLETRFDGYIWHHPNRLNGRLNDFSHAFLDFKFTMNGYVSFQNSYFLKTGVACGFYFRCIPDVRFNVQIGKYWDGCGAVRFGLFDDGIGIGGDYWVIYKKRFKWLTTLELAAVPDAPFLGRSNHLRPSIKWLNRFFILGTWYVSAGIDHYNSFGHHKNSITQGFLGFGSTI